MPGGCSFTVEVAAGGEGLVSRAGAALLARVGDGLGLSLSLSLRLAGLRQRRRGHDPGRVIRDLAVTVADGGECVSDLGAVGDQQALFGEVASDSTAFRVIDRIASEPELLDALRAAHASAREQFWRLHGAPGRLRIDLDATLVAAHSDKEGAAGNFKGGFGFHPLLAYADETREALAVKLRPGNAGANNVADQKAVLYLALGQIPAEHIGTLETLVRTDSAGATHELADYCHDASMRLSVGYDLTETIRTAILEIAEDAWVPALDQDDSERQNGELAEITDRLDLSSWPEGSRVLVGRERPHPGAQPSFTDHDGYRFQAILTDQPDQDIAVLERRHRHRARVEDRIRDDKDTGLAKLPFKEFALNEVWLQIVMLAHDPIVWTQALPLDGELQKAEPKRLRYRLLHVAGRLAFSGRRATLHLPRTRPCATELAEAFHRLKTPPSRGRLTAQPAPSPRRSRHRRPRSLVPKSQPQQPKTLPRKRPAASIISSPTPPSHHDSPTSHPPPPSNAYRTIRASRTVAGMDGAVPGARGRISLRSLTPPAAETFGRSRVVGRAQETYDPRAI